MEVNQVCVIGPCNVQNSSRDERNDKRKRIDKMVPSDADQDIDNAGAENLRQKLGKGQVADSDIAKEIGAIGPVEEKQNGRIGCYDKVVIAKAPDCWVKNQMITEVKPGNSKDCDGEQNMHHLAERDF